MDREEAGKWLNQCAFPRFLVDLYWLQMHEVNKMVKMKILRINFCMIASEMLKY